MRIVKAVAVVALALGAVEAAKHTVVKGDTLWDISGKYLKNPFQWQGVWKINPQVKNPHWIYPGDVITLPGGGSDTVVAVPDKDTLAKLDTSNVLSAFPLGPDHQKTPTLVNETEEPLNLVGNEAQHQLNPETVLLAPVWSQDTVHAGEGRILWEKAGGFRMLLPGRTVHVGLGKKKGLKVGDVVEVFETGDEVATIVKAEQTGRLEQLRAYLVVSEVSDESSLCLVSRMFGNVTSSARVRPAAAVATRPIKDFLVESSAAPVATAIANTSNSTLQMPGNYILLDHGTDAGLQQGDVVELSDATLPRGQESWRAFGITVRSDRGLATVFLTGVSDQRVRLGDKAYVIRRAVAF